MLELRFDLTTLLLRVCVCFAPSVRTMLMNQKDGAPRMSAILCAKQLFARQGIRGFYRGLSVSLARQVVPMAFMFGLVEVFRDALVAARSLIREEHMHF